MSSEKLPDKIIEKNLDRILSKPCNKKCADCFAIGPRWASLGYGVFVCMRCSGILLFPKINFPL